MNVADILSPSTDFQILQTTSRAQTATMRLRTGEASGERPQAHRESDQIVLLLKGDLHVELGDDEGTIHAGNSLLIPAGTPHRLVNRGKEEALAFTTYSPPAYPGDDE